jgi:hypothetical protein
MPSGESGIVNGDSWGARRNQGPLLRLEGQAGLGWQLSLTEPIGLFYDFRGLIRSATSR